MGLFSGIAKFVKNIFGAIGDVIGYVLGVDTGIDDQYKGQLVNKQSNTQKIPVIYGERLVGGTRVFVSTGGGKKNQYLYIALVLSEGEVESIGNVYINDVLSTDSKFNNKVTIYKYKGSDTQTATSLFNDANDSWTSAHQLKGVAYLAMRFKYDQDVFSGVPEVRAVVKGRKVYNPDTGITEWSDNPALCLRDYLTNTRYGKGLPTSAIDDASFIQAASDCNTLVTPYSGGTDIPLFKFNAIVDTGETVFNNVKKILASMRGIMPYSNGQYSLLIDKDQDSTFTLTEDNILSEIKVVSSSKENKFNQVIAKFPNPAKRWELDTVIFPESGSADETQFLNEDNQQILSKEITLHNVTNAYRAKDLARIACLASRNQSLTVNVTCTSEALNVAVGDIITLEHDSLGWTGAATQEFRVMGMVLGENGEVDFTLQQYDSSIYPWVEQSEQTDGPETTLPDPFTAQPVTTPTSTGNAVIHDDGTVAYFYDLEWAEPDDALIEYYTIDVNKVSNGVTTTAAETLQTQNLNYRYMVSDTSIDYGFTIKAVNGTGTRSVGVAIDPEPVVGDTTPPAAIATVGATVTSGLQTITLSWVNPSDEDFDLVRIKVNNTNSEPAEYFASVRSDTFVHDIGEYSTEKHYWVSPVDTSGNAAAYTYLGSAITGSIDYADVGNTPTIPEVATTAYLTLGDNDAPTDAEFNTAVGRDPIENDFVVVNKEFAFNYNGTAWVAVTEFIDGSLLVTGSISADDITTGTLNANDVTISNLTVAYDTQVTGTPDLSNFITGGDVNANVTSISGGVIQTGTAVTVGTSNNVAILSGADADYRIWAGNVSPSLASFSVTKEGVVNATGAIIDGNITAESLDVENATVTGTFIAPIGWSDGVYSGVINRGNLNESVKDLIDERIAEVTGGISGDFGQDDGSFSYIAQGNPDPDNPIVLNITHENGKDLTVELSGSRSWNRQFIGLPDTDMGVTIILERSPAGADTWTTLTTLTDSGSSITTTGPTLIHSSTYAYSISIYHVLTDDQASGNYDYRARTTVAGSAYSVGVPIQLTVVEPATVGAGNADTLDNEDGTYYLNYNNFTNTPDLSTKADLSGATFTGNIAISGDTTNIAKLSLSEDAPSNASNVVLEYDGTGSGDTNYFHIYSDVSGWMTKGSSLNIQPSTGKVDIGATTFTEKFNVDGNVNFTGTITASGYNKSNWDTAYTYSQVGHLPLAGGTLTGKLTLSATNPQIDFNGTSDGGVDMAIKATPEGLDFIEPEQADKIQFQILDDTGVNAPFGYSVGANQVIDSSRNLINIASATMSGNITASGDITASSVNLTGNLTMAIGTSIRQSYHSLYIGGGGLASSDRAIYIGNGGDGTGYGWEFFYKGSGSGNDNQLIIRSENLGSPVDVLLFRQGGTANFANTVNAPYVRLSSSNDASLSSTTHAFQVGSTAGQNLILDNNEVMSRNNGAVSNLFLNGDGGAVKINGNNTTNIDFFNGAITAISDSNHKWYSYTNAVGITHEFSDLAGTQTQKGYLKYFHANGASHGSGNAFTLTSTESTLSFAVDGNIIGTSFHIGFNSANSGTQIVDSARNATFATINTTGTNRFSGGYTYFGSTTANTAEVIINTANAGSPQITFTDNQGDMTWSIGGDDADNHFKLHGNYNSSIPIINSLSTPQFEWQNNGNFIVQGNITAYSDERLKGNIKTIDNALNKVSMLKGVTFDKIHEEEDIRHTGVIAQDVEKVLPEAVITHGTGYKSVAYGNMVGLLVEAIKELKSEIEELKNGNHAN